MESWKASRFVGRASQTGCSTQSSHRGEQRLPDILSTVLCVRSRLLINTVPLEQAQWARDGQCRLLINTVPLEQAQRARDGQCLILTTSVHNDTTFSGQHLRFFAWGLSLAAKVALLLAG